MRIAFFEDGADGGFGPLTLLRPSFELVCGARSLRERVTERFGATEWGAFVRERLADAYREEHPTAVVNDAAWLADGPTLLVNGCWLPERRDLDGIKPGVVGVHGDRVVYLVLNPDEATSIHGEDWSPVLATIASRRRFVDVGGRVLARPWDLLEHNAAQLEDDFEPPGPNDRDPATLDVIGPPERLRVARDADVEPQVVFDVRSGPITIEAGAVVQAFTRIAGPCHVAAGARLQSAKVHAGTTIGPACRVGGEVEASILHGYVNKAHAGFLGHAYVCPWVNLGALTTNSDLRNDYGSVRVPLSGTPVDTGATKVGAFIGDHVKTGLGCLFNTGTSVGVASMVLPTGELLPKHVPPFTRVWNGDLVEATDLDGIVTTARIVAERRGRQFGPAAEAALRAAFDLTAGERRAAIERHRERRFGRNVAQLHRAG